MIGLNKMYTQDKINFNFWDNICQENQDREEMFGEIVSTCKCIYSKSNTVECKHIDDNWLPKLQ